MYINDEILTILIRLHSVYDTSKLRTISASFEINGFVQDGISAVHNQCIFFHWALVKIKSFIICMLFPYNCGI